MKILMLADRLDIGGAETHIYELSRSLFFAGHEVKLLSGGGKTSDRLEALGIEVVKTDAMTLLPLSLPKALSELLALLRSFKPHVVHAHTRRGLFLCNLAKKIVPFPLVFTAHAMFSSGGTKRLFTNPPTCTIAVSEDIKRHFVRSFGADGSRVTVIENGIDTKRFKLSQPPCGALRILNVSRLDDDCSVAARLLCEIAPRLSQKVALAQIVIVGGGNDLGRIKALADDANRIVGRELVRCVGAKADVLPLLRECNLFVGVSRAALEAMCCGRPTVICGGEGYFGLCDGDGFDVAARENFCARGYAPPDAERLFCDILAFCRSGDLSRFRLRGRVVERYAAERMAQRTARVYGNAISEFRGKRKSDVVLCGYYGFGNLGDELVQASIRQRAGDLRIKVIGAVGGGRVNRLDLFSICGAVRGCSVFVLGGGSLLQNSTSRRSLWYYLALLKIADFFGRPTMLYANGIGPIRGEGAENACRRALAHVDVASTRDRASFDALEGLLPPSVRRYLSCDPALCVLSRHAVKPRIAIFIRGEDCRESLAEALGEAILRLLNGAFRGYEVMFASMNQRCDERAARYLCHAMPFAAGCRLFRDGAELCGFIAESELVVSSRLHALVIAASAGRPFIALGHDPKLGAFADECGLPDILAPSLSGERLGERLFEALGYAIERRDELSAQIEEAVAAMLPRGERDRSELEGLLE